MKRPAAAPLGRNMRHKHEKVHLPGKLPVSTLCGFLGAGKTTLLKHILETKHAADEGFRCAVIVNDMAEINIDKSLIDQSAVVQSDDVIAMQNGCVCCTLQNDLVTQIIALAKTGQFHYMIIEASGVSEPSQIAKLFAECDQDHDHAEEHEHEDALSEFAKLDTCVTVVDSADFFNKFHAIKAGPKNESFPHLVVEQIEYANVVVLNKSDLVGSAQLSKVIDQVSILNTSAKILISRNSKIDIMEVVNTNLYKAEDFSSLQIEDEAEELYMASCCKESIARGAVACCTSKRTFQSEKSKVTLANNRASKFDSSSTPRHVDRFGITSFVYQARRPFHPERFDKTFVEKFFVYQNKSAEEDDAPHETSRASTKQGKGRAKTSSRKSEKQMKENRRKEVAVRRQQRESTSKHQLRLAEMGDLFRSKGFLWLADRHDMTGMMSTAGSVMTIEFPEMWSVLQAKAYAGTEKEKAAVRKDWVSPWGDRRQDFVFIGKDLKHQAIQEILDSCLLTDMELAMGIDGWKATMGDVVLNAAMEGDDDESDE